MFLFVADVASTSIPAETVGIIVAAVVGSLVPAGYKYVKNHLSPTDGTSKEINYKYITREQYKEDQKRIYDLIYKNAENVNQLIGAITQLTHQK